MRARRSLIIPGRVSRRAFLFGFADSRLLPRACSVDDDARGVDEGVGSAECGDHAVSTAFDRAEVHEEHLIILVMDELAERVAAADEVRLRELTFEDEYCKWSPNPHMVLWTRRRRKSFEMS